MVHVPAWELNWLSRLVHRHSGDQTSQCLGTSTGPDVRMPIPASVVASASKMELPETRRSGIPHCCSCIPPGRLLNVHKGDEASVNRSGGGLDARLLQWDGSLAATNKRPAFCPTFAHLLGRPTFSESKQTCRGPRATGPFDSRVVTRTVGEPLIVNQANQSAVACGWPVAHNPPPPSHPQLSPGPNTDRPLSTTSPDPRPPSIALVSPWAIQFARYHLPSSASRSNHRIARGRSTARPLAHHGLGQRGPRPILHI